MSRQRSTSTAGSSRATLTNQPSKLSAPNQGPSGITTKQRLAQTAKAIVPASRPTLQRSNLSKLSFKKNAANTGSKPNTPVQEAHPSTSVVNEHTTASPMTLEDPSPSFQPSVQPAAPESFVTVLDTLSHLSRCHQQESSSPITETYCAPSTACSSGQLVHRS